MDFFQHDSILPLKVTRFLAIPLKGSFENIDTTRIIREKKFLKIYIFNCYKLDKSNIVTDRHLKVIKRF